MLTEMGAPGAGRESGPPRPSTSEHADTLRAARDTQHRAQELFALAAQARSDATEQAEQVIEEAQRAADALRSDAEREAERTRNELSGWASAQRSRVEALVSDVLETARTDADDIRAEALRTAMAEAQETARVYVAEATARGARDAEIIRQQARDLLTRASELGTGIGATLQGLADSFGQVTADLDGRRAELERILAEAAEKPSVPAPDLPPTPTALATATPGTDRSGGDAPAGFGGDPQTDAAAITDAIDFDQAPGAPSFAADAPAAPAAPAAPTATGAAGTAPESADSAPSATEQPGRVLPPRPAPRGRELGSMFRKIDDQE